MGRETRFDYDPLGQLSQTTDALGNRTVIRRDGHGNAVRVEDVDSIRDPETGVEVASAVYPSEFTYDELDRLIEQVDGLGNRTRYGYNSRDHVELLSDPRANRLRRHFDFYGDLARETRPLVPLGTDPGRRFLGHHPLRA